jgi:TOBE domain
MTARLARPFTRSPLLFPEAVVLSARNQFKGTVKSVKLGNVMAEVIVTVGNIEIVSSSAVPGQKSSASKPGMQSRPSSNPPRS